MKICPLCSGVPALKPEASVIGFADVNELSVKNESSGRTTVPPASFCVVSTRFSGELPSTTSNPAAVAVQDPKVLLQKIGVPESGDDWVPALIERKSLRVPPPV